MPNVLDGDERPPEPRECESCGDGTEFMQFVPEDDAYYCTMCGHAHVVGTYEAEDEEVL